MNASKPSVGGSGSHRSSKLTLTPLTVPPPTAFSQVGTDGDRSTPAHSLETPGRPGSARLAPLRNPPQAPPVVVDQALNLPDVDRAPFVAQRLGTYDGSESDSDDDVTFAIDLKPADQLPHIQPSQHAPLHAAPAAASVISQPASAASPSAANVSSSAVVSAAFLLPLNHSSAAASIPQPKAPDSRLLLACQPLASASAPHTSTLSPGASALDSGLSKREKEMLRLLSPDEQGHLHSHALSSVSNTTTGSCRSASSSSIAAAPTPVLNPSIAAALTAPAAPAINLSRKGSDAHSDGSWDDDEAPSGAR